MIGEKIKYLGKIYEVTGLAVDDEKVVKTIMSIKKSQSIIGTDYRILKAENTHRLYAHNKIWNLKKIK